MAHRCGMATARRPTRESDLGENLAARNKKVKKWILNYDPRALARSLSLAFAESALLRCGDGTRFDLPDEPSGNPRRGGRRHLSTALADRT